MRIAHVIDYFHTDIGYQEYYLAQSMAAAGHKVQVVSSRFRHHTVPLASAEEGQGKATLAAAGVDIVRLPAYQLGHDRAWLRGLQRQIAAFEPDAVHVHGPFNPTAARTAWAKGGDGFRLLIDNHLTNANTPGARSLAGRAAYGGFDRAAGPLLRSRVDSWVAVGPDEARFLHQHLSLELGAIELVPLGFDPTTFSFDEARRRSMRDERGWSDDIVVAITGKVHLGRRHDLVAAAVAKLHEHRSARLAVAGALSHGDRRTIEQAAGPLARDGRCQFTGMLGRRELADLFLCSDVVVFPHPPSISIFEAAGTGAQVWVELSAYASWLHSLSPIIEPVELAELPFPSIGPDGRATRARAAREAFSWPVLADRFVALYQGDPMP